MKKNTSHEYHAMIWIVVGFVSPITCMQVVFGERGHLDCQMALKDPFNKSFGGRADV